MSVYYIKLKDNVFLTPEEVEEIMELQLSTYEKRFPFENVHSSIEVFCEGTQAECLSKLNSFGEVKKYFEVFTI